MYVFPLLPEISLAKSIIFKIDSLFTLIAYLADKDPRRCFKQNQLLGVLKIQTKDLKHIVEKYWSSGNCLERIYAIADSCRNEILQQHFSNIIELDSNEKCIHAGLKFLSFNLIDEYFSYDWNQRENLGKYSFKEWETFTYPLLTCSLGATCTIHKFTDEDASELLATFVPESWIDYSLREYDALDILIELDKGKTLSTEREDAKLKTQDGKGSVLNKWEEWIDAIVKTICHHAIKEGVKKIYISDVELGLPETLIVAVERSKLVHCPWLEIVWPRHADMVSIIGSFVTSDSIPFKFGSWDDDSAYSSGMYISDVISCEDKSVIAQLVLEDSEFDCCPCPLLDDPSQYVWQTADVFSNKKLRDLLVSSMNGLLKTVLDQLEKEDVQIKKISKPFKERIYAWTQLLQRHPWIFGQLTLTKALKFIECLSSSLGSKDSFFKVKTTECDDALSLLPARLLEIDRITKTDLKYIELFKGILAGNFWDWMAIHFLLLRTSGTFDIWTAIDKIPERPWIQDDIEKWLMALRNRSYRKAFIFTDNSGSDFILGVVPFLRELGKTGTEIIICSVDEPTINDITHWEVSEVMPRIGQICPLLQEWWNSGRIRTAACGRKNVNIDFRCIPKELAEDMKDADLVITQGMGRGALTNSKLRLRCDLLQTWLVKEDNWKVAMNCRLFDGVCLFRPGTV